MQETCPSANLCRWLSCLVVLLAGCQAVKTSAPQAPEPVRPVYSADGVQDVNRSGFVAFPDPDNFTICHGRSCAHFAHISLTDVEWLSIENLFANVQNAGSEREAIARSIGHLEILAGNYAGTSGDLPQNRQGDPLSGQMDCVDEATNTTVYLSMMQRRGLLRWHHVEARQSRGLSTLQVLHWTAVIRDSVTGERHAVDSWFMANGEPAFVVPLESWHAGWQPTQ